LLALSGLHCLAILTKLGKHVYNHKIFDKVDNNQKWTVLLVNYGKCSWINQNCNAVFFIFNNLPSHIL